MSEADHEATLREEISADAAGFDTERAIADPPGAESTSESTTGPTTGPSTGPTSTGPAAADLTAEGPTPGEPALPGAQLGTVSRSRRPQLMAGVGLLALVLFVVRRLRSRRAPATPSERLTESARAVGAASRAAGGRAVEKLSDNAGPAAERAVELAKRGVATSADTAQRAAVAAKPVVAAAKPVVAAAATVAAREGLKAGSKAVDNAGDLAGDLAAKAGDVAGDVATIAAQAGQAVTSTAVDVAGSIGGVGQSVHKTWRKWTFRLWFSTFAAIGYVLGARAGRERYDQIMSLAGRVAQQPPVQQAKSKVSGAL